MGKILIVNDSRFERIVMQDQLSYLGFEAESTDEFSCLNEVDTYKPDIVIANLNMTEITGDKLIEIIKMSRPQIKCYLCSCSDISQDRYDKVDGVFKTPVKLGTLEQILVNE